MPEDPIRSPLRPIRENLLKDGQNLITAFIDDEWLAQQKENVNPYSSFSKFPKNPCAETSSSAGDFDDAHSSRSGSSLDDSTLTSASTKSTAMGTRKGKKGLSTRRRCSGSSLLSSSSSASSASFLSRTLHEEGEANFVDPGRRRGSEALLESRRIFEERQKQNRYVADSCGSSSSCILNMQQRCAKERNVDQKRDNTEALVVTAVTVPVAPTGRSGASTASSAARREAVARHKEQESRKSKAAEAAAVRRAFERRRKKVENPHTNCVESTSSVCDGVVGSSGRALTQPISPKFSTDHRVARRRGRTKGTALDDATFDGEDDASLSSIAAATKVEPEKAAAAAAKTWNGKGKILRRRKSFQFAPDRPSRLALEPPLQERGKNTKKEERRLRASSVDDTFLEAAADTQSKWLDKDYGRRGSSEALTAASLVYKKRIGRNGKVVATEPKEFAFRHTTKQAERKQLERVAAIMAESGKSNGTSYCTDDSSILSGSHSTGGSTNIQFHRGMPSSTEEAEKWWKNYSFRDWKGLTDAREAWEKRRKRTSGTFTTIGTMPKFTSRGKGKHNRSSKPLPRRTKRGWRVEEGYNSCASAIETHDGGGGGGGGDDDDDDLRSDWAVYDSAEERDSRGANFSTSVTLEEMEAFNKNMRQHTAVVLGEAAEYYRERRQRRVDTAERRKTGRICEVSDERRYHSTCSGVPKVLSVGWTTCTSPKMATAERAAMHLQVRPPAAPTVTTLDPLMLRPDVHTLHAVDLNRRAQLSEHARQESEAYRKRKKLKRSKSVDEKRIWVNDVSASQFRLNSMQVVRRGRSNKEEKGRLVAMDDMCLTGMTQGEELRSLLNTGQRTNRRQMPSQKEIAAWKSPKNVKDNAPSLSSKSHGGDMHGGLRSFPRGEDRFAYGESKEQCNN